MAAAFDTFSTATGTGTLTTSHTGAASGIGGVYILVGQSAVSGDQITGTVDYGGVTMTRQRMTLGAFTEAMTVYVYKLEAAIPQGTQTWTVPVSGAANKRAVCVTVTAPNGCEVHTDGEVANGSATNPQIALTITVDCVVLAVEVSGDSAANTITDTDYTIINEEDVVAQSRNFLRRTSNTATNETIVWTYNADEACGIAVAIREASAPVGAARTFTPIPFMR